LPFLFGLKVGTIFAFSSGAHPERMNLTGIG
jgi:hypothetical protein